MHGDILIMSYSSRKWDFRDSNSVIHQRNENVDYVDLFGHGSHTLELAHSAQRERLDNKIVIW